MAEEKETVVQEDNYLQQVLNQNKELQESLKSQRAEMDRIINDNNTLVKEMLEGATPKVEEDKKPAQHYADILFTDKAETLNDLQYVENSLKYRQACIEEGKGDPFVGKGTHYTPTDEDRAAAQRAADVYEHCIEFANGDNAVFMAELARCTAPGQFDHVINSKRR